MAKRLTDTDKWKKSWFRTMDPEYKCFWNFILDYCDFAGIWEVDFDLAEFYVGKSMDRKKIEEFFSKHIDVIDKGKRWFITDFILFQYGEKLKYGHNFHQKIIDRLNKAGLIKKYFTLQNGYYFFNKNQSDSLFDTLPDTLSITHETTENLKSAKTDQHTLSYTLSDTLSEKKENDKNEENDTLSDTLSNRVKEKDKVKDKVEVKEKEEEKGAQENSVRDTFEKFWKMYDKKIARLDCEKLWINLTPQERNEILEYVPKYVLSKPDKQYRLNPQKFLEGQTWFDEIVIPQLNGNKKNGHTKPTRENVAESTRNFKFGASGQGS